VDKHSHIEFNMSGKESCKRNRVRVALVAAPLIHDSGTSETHDPQKCNEAQLTDAGGVRGFRLCSAVSRWTNVNFDEKWNQPLLTVDAYTIEQTAYLHLEKTLVDMDR